jgi:hypothetical protein
VNTKKHSSRRFLISAAILAVFFSLITLLGVSFSVDNSWDPLFRNAFRTACSCAAFLALVVIFYLILAKLFEALDKKHIIRTKENRIRGYIERHPFLVAFVLILVCWTPWYIIYFPGNIPYDGYNQLTQFTAPSAEVSAHHPLGATIIIGSIFEVGRIAGDNAGVFLFVFLQGFLCAGFFAYTCATIKRLNVPILVYYLTLAYYALTPVWGAYAATVMKDTAYCAFFILLLATGIRIATANTVTDEKRIVRSDLLVVFIAGVLLSLFRNEGLFIVIAAMAGLLFVVRGKERLKIAAAGVLVVVCVLSINAGARAYYDIQPQRTSEMMSLPFQQTARTVRDYGNDLTPFEQETIQTTFFLTDFMELGELYHPETSDTVKGFGRPLVGLRNYAKTWTSMLLRHPDSYFQATFNGTYGYYYPSYYYPNLGPYQLYIKGGYDDSAIPTSEKLNISYLQGDGIRRTVTQYATLWTTTPILNLAESPGTHTWILLIVLVALLRKRRFGAAALCVASVMALLACIASPVNGYLRYAMPLLASTPLLIAWCLHELKVFTKATDVSEQAPGT